MDGVVQDKIPTKLRTLVGTVEEGYLVFFPVMVGEFTNQNGNSVQIMAQQQLLDGRVRDPTEAVRTASENHVFNQKGEYQGPFVVSQQENGQNENGATLFVKRFL